MRALTSICTISANPNKKDSGPNGAYLSRVGWANMLFVITISVLIAVFMCGVMLVIVFQTKRRSGNWGFNLNSIRDVIKGKPLLRNVVCPKCGQKQKDFRKPTDIKEILWGGWTCPKCGTKMDKWGNGRGN